MRRLFIPPIRRFLNLGWGLLAGCLLAMVFFSTACQAGKVDWTAWESMPVLDRGRLMPLDTFASCVVRDVCGRENPKLFPPQDMKSLDPKTRTTVERLFPNGEPRKFSAAELLYSWTVEPEVWEYIPFLKVSNETLREKGLEVPLYSPSGARLKHVSPYDFEQASKIGDLYRDLMRRRREAKQKKTTAQKTNEDKALLELIGAYNLYRTVVFTPHFDSRVNDEFQSQLLDVAEIWRGMAPYLAPWIQFAEADDPFSLAIRRTSDLTLKLSEQIRLPDVKTVELAETAAQLANAASELALEIEKNRNKVFNANDSQKAFLQKGRAVLNRLAVESGQLAKSARLLELVLYDRGRSIRVVPSLNRLALERERDPRKILQPWINLQTLLYAPESVLEEFPIEKVAAVRKTFETAKQNYLKLSPQDVKNIEAFNASLQKFTEQLRALGETLTAERAKLDLQDLDKTVLAQTAYPPVGAFDIELRYNRLNPFLWSWILTLAALVFFVLAWGFARTPMLLVGLLLLILGQVATCYGLTLRMIITEMVPVTNMFETILFVGVTTGVLTICVAIYPILQAGLSTAWRLTAWPGSAEARSLSEVQLRLAGLLASGVVRWLLFAIRFGLALGVVYVLAIGSFSPDGEKSALSLLPRVTDQGIGGLLGAVILWIVGIAILAWAVWFIPRALPTIVLALVLTPISWWQLGLRDGLKRTVERRSYLIAGSAVALLIYLVGYWTPQSVFNRDVGTGMMPILRNNFWLAIHVLIITASYGAGALAWGIGNISTAYYLFGRYEEAGSPKVAHVLANYIYRMMQIAVLLLAAGTITGAIWADFAWGRYWGWDPKEVWALITLFVYLAILHGRWARWIGDFGMAAGSVLGFTSIIIAWYGVNLIGGGLHSYGNISGGFYYILILAAVNWLFVVAAVIRYQIVKQSRMSIKEENV